MIRGKRHTYSFAYWGRLDQTSSQIRSAIKEDMAPTPWPYHPSDVNSSAIPDQPEHLRVGYLPTINAPATELNTVFEILNQSERIRKELLLEMIVVVMDQALFAIAAEIAWK